jgi:hypothetical protein
VVFTTGVYFTVVPGFVIQVGDPNPVILQMEVSIEQKAQAEFNKNPYSHEA